MVDTLHPPPEVLRSWPKPNYVDPYQEGPALFIIALLFSVVGAFIVSARLYSRIFLTRAPGIDDVFITLGLLLTIALSSLVCIDNQKYFTGRHIWDVPVSTYSPHRLNIWICEWFYLAAAAFIKISVLLFYRRLSVSFSRGFLIATWVGIAYNLAVWFAFVMCLLNLCRPIKAYWKAYDFMWAAGHEFHCDTEQVTLPLSGGLSMLGDLYATLLPMYMVNIAARNHQQKVALYALFGLGFLSVGCGIVRTYLMNRIINIDYDFLIPLYYMWIVTIIELYIAIFAASAPALKPFFKRFLVQPVSKGSTSSSRSAATKPSGQWSQGDSTMTNDTIDLEKVGITHGFPEQIKPGTHTTWIEMMNGGGNYEQYEMQDRRHSKMVSFPEERTPSISEIAVAR